MIREVCEVVAETINCDIDSLTENTKLQEDLGVDSLDAVEVNMALEEKFDISISDEELAELKTIEDIVSLIEGKLN